MDIITELQNEEKELEKQLSAIREKIKIEKLKSYKKDLNIEVGSIVIYRNREYKVFHIDTKWGDRKPWIKGIRKNNNGEFGKKIESLYSDWESIH